MQHASNYRWLCGWMSRRSNGRKSRRRRGLRANCTGSVAAKADSGSDIAIAPGNGQHSSKKQLTENSDISVGEWLW